MAQQTAVEWLYNELSKYVIHKPIGLAEWEILKELTEQAKAMDKEYKANIRTAVADYICSEGCSCCEGKDHKDHAETLAKLLDVPKYEDGSGYNFYQFRKYYNETYNK